MTPRTRIFRYVRFCDVDAYLGLGWYYDGSIMHAPHGCYAVLMEFLGEGEAGTSEGNALKIANLSKRRSEFIAAENKRRAIR